MQMNNDQNQQQAQEHVPVWQVQNQIKDKQDLYDSCVRNGYYLPLKAQRLNTVDFMNEVKDNIVWVPKRNELMHHTCAQPPKRQYIQDQLILCIQNRIHDAPQHQRQSILRLVTHLQQRQADKEWLLTVLYTICQGNHPMFGKNYRPPVDERRPIKFAQQTVVNVNGFYNDLPQSQSKSKRTIVNKLARNEHNQFKMRKVESKIQRLNEMRNQLQNYQEAFQQMQRNQGIPNEQVNQNMQFGQPMQQPNQFQMNEHLPVQQQQVPIAQLQPQPNQVQVDHVQDLQQVIDQRDIEMQEDNNANRTIEEVKENPPQNNRPQRSPPRRQLPQANHGRAAAQRARELIAPNHPRGQGEGT